MFSKIASRLLLPQFEHDLSQSMKSEMSKLHKMVDCMIAPTIHAFEPVYIRGYAPTPKQAQRIVKIDYPLPNHGTFRG